MVFNVVSAEFIVVNVEFIVVSAVLRGVSITSMSGVVVGGKNTLVTCHINLLPRPTPARVHNAFLLYWGRLKCPPITQFLVLRKGRY